MPPGIGAQRHSRRPSDGPPRPRRIKLAETSPCFAWPRLPTPGLGQGLGSGHVSVQVRARPVPGGPGPGFSSGPSPARVAVRPQLGQRQRGRARGARGARARGCRCGHGAEEARDEGARRRQGGPGGRPGGWGCPGGSAVACAPVGACASGVLGLGADGRGTSLTGAPDPNPSRRRHCVAWPGRPRRSPRWRASMATSSCCCCSIRCRPCQERSQTRILMRRKESMIHTHKVTMYTALIC